MATIRAAVTSWYVCRPQDGDEPRGPSGAFEVHLDVFEGPFDLLLGLISKHKLDITEVALSQVTDEFIAYIRSVRRLGPGQVSYFLVVAATLLDLKAARLLPVGRGGGRGGPGPAGGQGPARSPGCCSTARTRRVAAVFAARMTAAGPPVPAPGAAGAAVRRAAARGAARPRAGRVRRGSPRCALAPKAPPEGIDRAHPLAA